MLLKKFAVKPALLGGLCLLGAFLLAWLSPRDGVLGLLGMGVNDGAAGEGMRTKVRERDGAEGRVVGNLAEEYTMKAKRGMTVNEVRWVVEDFVALGLNVDYPENHTAEGYLALRKAREDWYLGALVSGLRLTKEQEAAARKAMGVLGEKDFTELQEYLAGVKSFEHEGQEMKVVDGSRVRKLMDAGEWMKEEGYRPWNLCELSGEQEAVTWKVADGATGEAGGEGQLEGFLGFGFYKGVGGEARAIEGFSYDPFEPVGWEFFGKAGLIFPLSAEQIKRVGETDFASDLELVMLLQPEQLKVLLLLSDRTWRELLAQFERRSE